MNNNTFEPAAQGGFLGSLFFWMRPMRRFVADDNQVSCDFEASRAAYRAFTAELP